MSEMPDLGGLLGEVARMQQRMAEVSERLGEIRGEGIAGGGLVGVVANGRREVVSVRIDPKALEDGDVELLEDLIRAAANVALKRAAEEADAAMKSALGGFVPPGMDLAQLTRMLGGTG